MFDILITKDPTGGLFNDYRHKYRWVVHNEKGHEIASGKTDFGFLAMSRAKRAARAESKVIKSAKQGVIRTEYVYDRGKVRKKYKGPGIPPDKQ